MKSHAIAVQSLNLYSSRKAKYDSQEKSCSFVLHTMLDTLDIGICYTLQRFNKTAKPRNKQCCFILYC